MDMNAIESALKMNYIFFPECLVKRERVIQNGSLNVDIKKNIEKNNDHEFTLKVILKVEKNDLYVSITCVAGFSFMGENEEIEDNLVRKNGMAIVFPFLRSQMTLLTSQPNMTPVVLPAININKVLD